MFIKLMRTDNGSYAQFQLTFLEMDDECDKLARESIQSCVSMMQVYSKLHVDWSYLIDYQVGYCQVFSGTSVPATEPSERWSRASLRRGGIKFMVKKFFSRLITRVFIKPNCLNDRSQLSHGESRVQILKGQSGN